MAPKSRRARWGRKVPRNPRRVDVPGPNSDEGIDGNFEGTGSGIGTMHKDLTISLDMAEELGVPLFTAATAMQIFHQGKSKYPHGDNWICTRIIEDIVGAELHR